MNTDEPDFIDVKHLRIGMFVELDVGWMAHPFPSGSFKISSLQQIETIRSLGLARVRHVVAKSDPVDSVGLGVAKAPAGDSEQSVQLAQTLQIGQLARRQRAIRLRAQQQSLDLCERRFGEATRLYRKTLEQVHTQPVQAAAACQALVSGLVGEVLSDGESSIRLLTENAGEKSAIHTVNVTVISLLLGRTLGLNPQDMQDLGVAAFLHDIGKIDLPDRVRWPEDNFSASEYKLYQEHVGRGIELAKTMALSPGATQAIGQHHELADGSGFPARLPGGQMTVAAKIIALVNRYDNLCNPSRPSAALTPHEALSLIFAQLKTRFDAAVLSGFIRMMGVYPAGSVVQLVDDRFASVVSVNSLRPLRPRLIVHEPDVPKHEALVLNLEHSPQLGIRRSLKPSSLPTTALEYLGPRQRISYFLERVVEDAEPVA